MAKNKKMTTAEILAAARGAGGAAKAASSEAVSSEKGAEPAEKPAAPEKPAATAKPAAGKKIPSKGPGRPSVAEMLAMARAGGGGKGDVAAEKPAAKKPAAKKPAAAKKESPKGAVAKSGPRDTASILAAARKASKPGPTSKAEAASRGASEKAAIKSKPPAPPMPVKPEYARAGRPAAARKPAEDRRGFLSVILGSFLGIGFTSLAGATGLMGLGLARFMFPNILTEPPSRFKIGFPGDFSPGVVETKYKAQFGVWVANGEYNGRKEIYALKSVCTHLGCTPSWLESDQKFKCPCHGSGFYKDGINFEGPAPRPLERYAIKLADDGKVEIDKSKVFQEELGQWNDPACYISMG